jgi:5-formyltetrahydrofolate cyclo-ligase
MSRKERLRQQFCTLRECLPETDVAASSAAICRQLAAWQPLAEAETVLTFLAFRNEPDLSALFRLLPHIRWAVPRIEGHRLRLHAYDATRLIRHRFGMLEPDPAVPEISPEALDVVLAPGVAFDRHGGRIGFGGGFYDRFLITTPALRVGVTHSACLAEELPCQPHDQRMDYVATPEEIIACAPERQSQSDRSA